MECSAVSGRLFESGQVLKRNQVFRIKRCIPARAPCETQTTVKMSHGAAKCDGVVKRVLTTANCSKKSFRKPRGLLHNLRCRPLISRTEIPRVTSNARYLFENLPREFSKFPFRNFRRRNLYVEASSVTAC